MFVEDLFSFLSDQATDAASRIYPNELPQNATMPAVKYFQVSDPPEHTHDGRSELRHPRWQLDCFAETYLAAHALAEQVVTALDGYRGQIGQSTCGAGFAEDERDNHDPETGRHWVSVDIEIWYS
ncbi:MAG: DUF3168 domain-containing protein [Anaerolineaceae bacterium]|nr:MAG: DUF3168 domain-containing protein [Anaerolineaceae bacterium]